MEARATVTNTGLNSKTAIRVAGKVPLNNTTPIKPLSHPFCLFGLVLPILIRAISQISGQSSLNASGHVTTLLFSK
jgi:hypothetical protein